MKAILAVALMFAFGVQAATLESVLANSAPTGERGACPAQTKKHGVLVLQCAKGLRIDGAAIYTAIMDGEIIAVFEQVSKDTAPKQIWGIDWQEI